MKSVENSLNEARGAALLLLISILLISNGALLISGCANTVIPRTVSDRQASWDGTNQNSGFLGFADPGHGLITAHARDRYNALVETYGARFHPGLVKDAGITPVPLPAPPGLYLIDAQHLQYFMQMQRWYKSHPEG